MRHTQVLTKVPHLDIRPDVNICPRSTFHQHKIACQRITTLTKIEKEKGHIRQLIVDVVGRATSVLYPDHNRKHLFPRKSS